MSQSREASSVSTRLPLTLSPALFPSIQPRKMGLSSFGFCGSYRRAAGTSEIRKSGKLHPNFWNCFPEKRVLASWMRAGLPVLPCFPAPLASV
jgi:hypothetical protein